MLTGLFLFTPPGAQAAENERTQYPDIPRIDVHTHAADDPANIKNYLAVRESLLCSSGIDLAFWINLENAKTPITDPAPVTRAAQGRMLCAYGDYSPHKGLKYKPEDIARKRNEGFIGFKLWFGPYYRRLEPGEEGIRTIDHPQIDVLLGAVEKEGVPCLSLHIIDPNGPFGNRQPWCEDPVEFWRQITAFETVLKRHPNLTVVAAHCAWLVCQDAQLDYLRYLLSTYPNLHVDLAATFQYYHLLNRENLRDFLIEYADRILYGTDISTVSDKNIESIAKRYLRTFLILETDGTIEGGFFGDAPTRGLALPEEVLEKIYYKNALRLYPKLAERFAATAANR